MAYVCSLLEGAWPLLVVCPCISDDVPACTQKCMTNGVYALGVAMHRQAETGMVYVHLPSLTEIWQLKYGVPLQSSWAVSETALGNLFTGVLMNCRRFMTLWYEHLLSAASQPAVQPPGACWSWCMSKKQYTGSSATHRMISVSVRSGSQSFTVVCPYGSMAFPLTVSLHCTAARGSPLGLAQQRGPDESVECPMSNPIRSPPLPPILRQ